MKIQSKLGDAKHPAGRKTEVITETLETARLILKLVTPEVFNEVFTTLDDAAIIDFLGLTDQAALDAERIKWEQGMTTYRISFISFLLIEKETGKLIGKCALHNWYAMHHRSEIGYHIVDETAKRKGYMTEAVVAIIRYGFEQLGLNRIEAFTSPANVPSRALLEGQGFTQEGILRSDFFKDGEYVDSVCYSLLRSEYESMR